MTNAQGIDALFLTLTILPDISQKELLRANGLVTKVDWENVVTMASTHGVLGIHCSFLIESNMNNIPKEIIEAAHYFLNEHKKKNHNNLTQLATIIDKLNAHDIKAIPFKGPTLSYLAYDDFSLRTFRDLDFLIELKDREKTIRLLNELGYQQDQMLTKQCLQAFYNYSGQDILFAENRVPVEPHWELAPSTYALNINYSVLRKRAVLSYFENHQFWHFNFEDYFIVLCLHGSKEKWSKLKWVADIAWYIKQNPELKWQVIQDRAKGQGIAKLISLALLVTSKVFNTKLPEPAKNIVTTDTKLMKIADNLSAELFCQTTKGKSIYFIDYYHWLIKDNFKDKLSYLFLTIFTPRVQHFKMLNIPDKLFIFYYPLKLIHDYCLLPLWLCFKWSRNKLRIK